MMTHSGSASFAAWWDAYLCASDMSSNRGTFGAVSCFFMTFIAQKVFNDPRLTIERSAIHIIQKPNGILPLMAGESAFERPLMLYLLQPVSHATDEDIPRPLWPSMKQVKPGVPYLNDDIVIAVMWIGFRLPTLSVGVPDGEAAVGAGAVVVMRPVVVEYAWMTDRDKLQWDQYGDLFKWWSWETVKHALSVKWFDQWKSDLNVAFDVLHGAGWLWNDAKPNNLIISPTGRMQLMDFGNMIYLSEFCVTRAKFHFAGRAPEGVSFESTPFGSRLYEVVDGHRFIPPVYSMMLRTQVKLNNNDLYARYCHIVGPVDNTAKVNLPELIAVCGEMLDWYEHVTGSVSKVAALHRLERESAVFVLDQLRDTLVRRRYVDGRRDVAWEPSLRFLYPPWMRQWRNIDDPSEWLNVQLAKHRTAQIKGVQGDYLIPWGVLNQVAETSNTNYCAMRYDEVGELFRLQYYASIGRYVRSIGDTVPSVRMMMCSSDGGLRALSTVATYATYVTLVAATAWMEHCNEKDMKLATGLGDDPVYQYACNLHYVIQFVNTGRMVNRNFLLTKMLPVMFWGTHDDLLGIVPVSTSERSISSLVVSTGWVWPYIAAQVAGVAFLFFTTNYTRAAKEMISAADESVFRVSSVLRTRRQRMDMFIDLVCGAMVFDGNTHSLMDFTVAGSIDHDVFQMIFRMRRSGDVRPHYTVRQYMDKMREMFVSLGCLFRGNATSTRLYRFVTSGFTVVDADKTERGGERPKRTGQYVPCSDAHFFASAMFKLLSYALDDSISQPMVDEVW